MHSKLDNPLTGRQAQILACVVDGLANKQIADRLHISEKAVKNHLTELFSRLDVQSRTQLAVYALRNGLAS